MRKRHIRVYDRDMNLKAILNKAYKIGYDLEQNNLWTCKFTMPLNDKKNTEIIPKNFIELWDFEKRIGMFVVQPIETVKNESNRSITYTCEHVLGTLHSEVLFGYHQFTNWKTRDVLQALIDTQDEVFWRLGKVDFTRYFHYAWENEDSLLNAIVSVPKPFDVPYLWTWDDTTFPFTLNLISPIDEHVDTLRFGKNLKGINKDIDSTELYNRIYPLGYGEGVNQLTIKKVNNGVPYVEDTASIAKYGLHKKVWADRRFEDANALKASTVGLLKSYKDPKVTVSVDCINYELIDPYQIVKYGVGKIMRVEDEDTNTYEDLRIMKISRSDIYGNPDDIKFDLANIRERLETTITDLEKKQLVNETYSQGSTNIMTLPYIDSCDPDNPMIIRFPIWNDVVNINTFSLTYEVEPFRAYSKAIEGGGGISTTTKGGGAFIDNSTTADGGAYIHSSTTKSGGAYIDSSTTQNGGASIDTTSSAGLHRHRMFSFQVDTDSTTPPDTFKNYIASSDSNGGSSTGIFAPSGSTNDLYTEEAAGEHSHTVSIPAHSHGFQVNVPAHSHGFDLNIPEHKHDYSFTIPEHTHPFELPNHVHGIQYGIFESPVNATSLKIEVNGVAIPETGTSNTDLDLIPYLPKDSSGQIVRGRYVEIKITPNNLARINATLTSRLFIQSRMGSTY